MQACPKNIPSGTRSVMLFPSWRLGGPDRGSEKNSKPEGLRYGDVLRLIDSTVQRDVMQQTAPRSHESNADTLVQLTCLGNMLPLPVHLPTSEVAINKQPGGVEVASRRVDKREGVCCRRRQRRKSMTRPRRTGAQLHGIRWHRNLTAHRTYLSSLSSLSSIDVAITRSNPCGPGPRSISYYVYSPWSIPISSPNQPYLPAP
jgi:hypothetical protein